MGRENWKHLAIMTVERDDLVQASFAADRQYDRSYPYDRQQAAKTDDYCILSGSPSKTRELFFVWL